MIYDRDFMMAEIAAGRARELTTVWDDGVEYVACDRLDTQETCHYEAEDGDAERVDHN